MDSSKVITKVKLYASTYDVKRDKSPFMVIAIDPHKISEREAILKATEEFIEVFQANPFMIDGCIKVERGLK